MWVEILPTSIPMKDQAVYEIIPKPPDEMQIRIVIYDTENLKCMDAEGTSDAFFRVFFDSKEALETDTHFRCSDGKASFNYRILFPFSFPGKNYKLTVQGFDRDFFKSNDIIGENTLDLFYPLEDASLTARPMSLNKEYYNEYLSKKGVTLKWKDDDCFWVDLMGQENGELVCNGRVRMRIDIYPKDK